MKKEVIRLLVVFLIAGTAVLACSLTGLETNQLPSMPTITNTADESLIQTAKAQLLTEIASAEADHAQSISVTPSISFEDKISTAVAETQIAHNAQLSIEQRIQTAIALTQIAAMPNLSFEQRVQTAMAQTQIAQKPTGTPSPMNAAVGVSSVNDPLFNSAYVYRYGFLTDNKYLVTLQLANTVSGGYYAVIGGKNYKCSIIAAYPNRLYCNGPSVQGGAQSLMVYETTSNRLVYVGQVVLPQWTPTRVRVYDNWCCETGRCFCPSPVPYYHPCCYDDPNDCYYQNHTTYDRTCFGYSCSKARYNYDGDGKCYYFDSNGDCRYCKTGNRCK